MASSRVKKGQEKGPGGAPRTFDLDPFLKMGDDLLEWSKNPPMGSYFKDFILDYPYTDSQVEYALANSEEFLRKWSLARQIFTRNYRLLAHQSNNRMYEKLMPLIDKDYKEWRMTELKLQAIANADPKAALEEIMNKSEKPVKE